MTSTATPPPVAPATVLADCYCLNAQRAARRLARLYDDALRPLALSHGQFSLLMLVAGLQPASVGQLAAELVMDRTTVTAVLKPLERRGLLQSLASPTDQRQRLLALTPPGHALLKKATLAWQQAQALVQAQRPRAAVRSDLQRLAATAAAPAPRKRLTPGATSR